MLGKEEEQFAKFFIFILANSFPINRVEIGLFITPEYGPDDCKEFGKGTFSVCRRLFFGARAVGVCFFMDFGFWFFFWIIEIVMPYLRTDRQLGIWLSAVYGGK